MLYGDRILVLFCLVHFFSWAISSASAILHDINNEKLVSQIFIGHVVIFIIFLIIWSIYNAPIPQSLKESV